MITFTFYENPTTSLVSVSGGDARYSLESAASLAGIHPDRVLYYVRAGLIEPSATTLWGEPFFDVDALNQLRRIQHYRRHLGAGFRALPLICELQREGERQEVALRFLELP